MRAPFVLVVMAALAGPLGGCGRKPPDATAEGVAREFLDRMERVQGEPRDARAAFDLLSKAAQTSLSDRSRRASAAFGKRMGPEQMLTPSHFFPRFQPRQWTTRLSGKRALVEVVGLDASSERGRDPVRARGRALADRPAAAAPAAGRAASGRRAALTGSRTDRRARGR